MVVCERLLSEAYKFNGDIMTNALSLSQINAQNSFFSQLHNGNEYCFITRCPYCEKENFTKISEIDNRGLPVEIVICNYCDGCFKLNVLNQKANQYHYENLSYALRGKDLSSDAIEQLFYKRVSLFAVPRYHFISHFISLNSKKDSIVELGCNDGANLYPWQEAGFDVLGIDLDCRVVEFGKTKGLNLVCADSLNYEFYNKKPKLIILSHMLEHVLDINYSLEKFLKILRPDGYVFVEVPGIKTQGISNPLSYFDVEHNYNFDMKSISRVLEKHAFRILYSDEYIRIICTPNQKHVELSCRFSGWSFSKIIAGILEKLIKRFEFSKMKLFDLLRRGARHDLMLRIFNKLQALYFMNYYNYIIELENKNERYKKRK